MPLSSFLRTSGIVSTVASALGLNNVVESKCVAQGKRKLTPQIHILDSLHKESMKGKMMCRGPQTPKYTSHW